MNKVSSVKESFLFTKAYKKGGSAVSENVVVYALKRRGRGTDLPSCLGITVSKKYGNAVMRTRARRIIREAYRTLNGKVRNGYDVIVVARHSLAAAKMQDAGTDLEYAFRKLGILTEKTEL